MESIEYPTVIQNGEKARKRAIAATRRSKEKENRYEYFNINKIGFIFDAYFI